MNKKLDNDLKAQRDINKKSEMTFMGDLETIRKELNRCCKNNQEMEVTNSELKEEVGRGLAGFAANEKMARVLSLQNLHS